MSTVSAVCHMPDYDVSGPYLNWPIHIEEYMYYLAYVIEIKGRKREGIMTIGRVERSEMSAW